MPVLFCLVRGRDVQMPRWMRTQERMRLFRFFAGMATAAALAFPAGAERTDSVSFKVYLKGLPIGILAFNGIEKDGAYAVAGKLKATGIVGALLKVGYEAEVRGAVANGAFVPARYKEIRDDRNGRRTAWMEYRDGVPGPKRYDPPRKSTSGVIDPATQKGTVDPLTALYVVLRDQDGPDPCDRALAIFDGKKRAGLRLSPLAASPEEVRCSGEYRRVAGYSAREMREKPVFPFTITYRLSGGRWRAERIDTDTIHGRAVLRRR